ncbi:MAG: hypothetical protein C4306_10325 [Thermoleophilia bacterium]
MPVELPEGKTVAVELDLDDADLAEIRRRAAGDELAPDDEAALLRYLVYLGAAYVEVERTVEEAGSLQAAHAAVYARYGQAGAGSAVLRFHYGEASRLFAARRRSQAAHEITQAIYADTARRIEEEIAVRAERVCNLKAALADAPRAARS